MNCKHSRRHTLSWTAIIDNGYCGSSVNGVLGYISVLAFLTDEFRLSNNCDRLITIIKLDWLRYYTVASKFILPQIYNNVIFRSIMTHISKY